MKESEIVRKNERKKERARKKKVRAENEEKRSTLREKENTGNCPFENIGFYLVITEWLTSARKPLETQGFRAFLQFRKMLLQHVCNSQWKKHKKE